MAWTHFEATPELRWEKGATRGRDMTGRTKNQSFQFSHHVTWHFVFVSHSKDSINVTDCNRSCTCDSSVGGNFYRQYPEISLKLKSNKKQISRNRLAWEMRISKNKRRDSQTGRKIKSYIRLRYYECSISSLLRKVFSFYVDFQLRL